MENKKTPVIHFHNKRKFQMDQRFQHKNYYLVLEKYRGNSKNFQSKEKSSKSNLKRLIHLFNIKILKSLLAQTAMNSLLQVRRVHVLGGMWAEVPVEFRTRQVSWPSQVLNGRISIDREDGRLFQILGSKDRQALHHVSKAFASVFKRQLLSFSAVHCPGL